MFLLRVLGLLLLVAIALCVGAWLLTGERGYWFWAKRLFRYGLAVGLLFMALLVFERLLAPIL